MLFIIYFVRSIVLFLFSGKNIILELFLAPRGLVTILLFFAIPSELSLGSEFQGVLLFVILISCLIMTWSLISYKKETSKVEVLEEEQFDNLDSDLVVEKENEDKCE